MASSMTDRLKGRSKQTAGKAKEVTSRWIGDRTTAAEGRREQMMGKMQETKGAMMCRLKKLIDKF